jgi:nucleotide-binding universal stress UspA family protein
MLGITVGMDGSANSRRALKWAMREAAVRHCALTVITIHETVASFWTGDPVTTRADEALQHQAREAAVDAVAQEESRLGEARPAVVKVRAVTGFPAQELLDASGVTDLLVIGARGGGGFHRLALGSVSSQVVHHAECPVVVVPGPART